jgi:hypothetical protein
MKMKGPVVGKKKEHERYEENTDGFDQIVHDDSDPSDRWFPSLLLFQFVRTDPLFSFFEDVS